MTLSATATGGAGGEGGNGGNAGNGGVGGRAAASADVIGSGAIMLDVISRGGLSEPAPAGPVADAPTSTLGVVRATSTDGQLVNASASLTQGGWDNFVGIGGSAAPAVQRWRVSERVRHGDWGGGGSSSGNGNGGVGGIAHASAVATGAGTSAVTVNATATGGNGGAGSGTAGKGGLGGIAVIDTAAGTSPAGGAVSVTAVQAGGAGGNPVSAAVNGDGADSFIQNRVTGSTTGALSLIQTAVGGNAGAVSTAGGKGGNATSILQLQDLVASSFSLTANATGGSAPASGTSGAATAVAQATGAQVVNAAASATSPGQAASASASAQTPASPTSADAAASGLAAQANGSTQTALRFITSAQSIAGLPSGVVGTSRARAAAGQTIVSPSTLTANQSAAVITAAPRNVDTLLTLFTNSNVRRTLNIGGEGNGPRSDVLAVAAIGGDQPATVTAAPQTFSASTSLVVDPTKLSSPQDLVLGLLHPQVKNAGFDTMRLRVLSGDKALADQTFSSVPTASTYFEDIAIDFGPWLTGASRPVTLTVLMDVTASKADQRSYASLLLANATLNSGGLPADASHDGKVGFADFQRLELNFGGPATSHREILTAMVWSIPTTSGYSVNISARPRPRPRQPRSRW